MLLYQGNELRLNGKIITFPANIIKIIELKDMVLVLLEESSKYNKKIPSNLFLYSLSGDKFWEAELPKEMPYTTYEPEYYDSVNFENNELMASSFRWFCVLDMKTGKIKTLYPNK